MFGRKCTLCGEKLDSRGFCTECGLNNNKSEKHYKVNESSCDNESLTHIHEETENKNQAEVSQQKQKTVKPQQKANTLSKKHIITILTVLVTIAGIGVSIIKDQLSRGSDTDVNIDDIFNSGENISDTSDLYEDYDPYQWVTQTLPEEGESAEYTLASGNYIVGVHIPEGIYQAEVKDSSDAVKIVDFNNSIFLYDYSEEDEGNYLEDLRFYQGATVSIYTNSEIKLSSDNVQTTELKATTANPLTETVKLEAPVTSVAGKEFAAGIYDVYCREGTGNVDISIIGEDGQEEASYYLFNNKSNPGKNSFKYVVLPAGAIVKCGENVSVEMIPSENIVSDDYMGFYNQTIN